MFDLRYGKALVASARRPGRVPVYGTNGQCGSHDTPLFSGPGVVLGRKGQGPLGVEWVDGDYWVIDTAYALALLDGDVDLKYAYYLIKHVGLNHLKDGTSNPSLGRDAFGAQLLPRPPLAVQRAIATVLGSLDAKIDANARLVPLLRDVATSTLQRAANPRATHRVADVADVRKGLSYTGAGLADTGMPMVNLANAEELGWLKRSGFKHYAGAYKARHIAKPGSLMVSGVDLTWKLRIIGWPMLLPDDVGEALFSQDVFLVDFRPEHAWLRLPLWAHLFSVDARVRLEGMAYGTTVARFPADALTGLEIPAPRQDDPALQAADSLLRRAWAAERETAALAALRDALLPPLISGELRVRDAESLVGEAV
jgi:type I restriction enzyme S subunit